MIDILCSDPRHPVWPYLARWAERNGARLVSSSADLEGGDLLFLVSCSEVIRESVRERYRAALVLHASDLPKGRGWSPHVWSVLEGRKAICVSLIEAADPVDSGAIWAQRWFVLMGTELVDEIDALLFETELTLMDLAVAGAVWPRPQAGPASYHRRRTPEDSRLDPERSIADQFDLLRVCDPVRYPAFVEMRGQRYTVTLRRADA